MPSQTIPPEAAAVLRPELPRLADDMIAAIAREVPGYRRAMEGTFGKMVRLGVETALGRFVDSLEDPSQVGQRERETYLNLGRGELHAGRSLDTLLAAYRVGARLAWRRFVEAGVAGGLAPDVMYRLGEAIFDYIDELSAESAEGYALEQLAEAGERRRRRRQLIALLAQDPPAPEEGMRTAASNAGWDVPRSLAALVAAADDDPEEAAERLARRVGQGAVGGAVQGLACAFVPDADAPGRPRQIEAALEVPGALGPTVPWTHAGESVRRAIAAHELLTAGTLAPDGRLLVAHDHLGALLLHADPPLAADLAASRLAPLWGLPDGQRVRMTETLRAWLDRPGQVQAIAAALDVHPQTVRYRMGRLRELFGTRLDDPDARFELALALRAAA